MSYRVLELNSALQVPILHVKGLHTPVKRQSLLDWVKKRVQLSAVYKKSILNIRTQIVLKDGKRYTMQIKIIAKWK